MRIPTSLGVAMVMVVTATVAPTPSRATAAAPQLPAATSLAAADAAPYYRHALDLLYADPAAIDLPDDKPPLDATIAQFLERHKPALECLDHASRLARANWSPGELTETATLGKLRHFATVGMHRARSDFALGKKEQAMNDLLAVAALGRHVGQANLMLTTLVDIGIEAQVVDELAKILPDLGPALVAKLARRLDALPPTASFGEVILGEHAYARDLTKQGNALGQPWDEATLAAAKPFYVAIAESAALAPEEFAKKVDAALANQPPNVLAFTSVIAQPLKPLRVPTATMEAKHAMLKTAAAIVATGPDAAKHSKDPFGGAPFAYRALPNGFELTSKLLARNKPVTLTVGPE